MNITTDTDCSCHVPSNAARLLDLFDATAQCRAMVHLDTTSQPDAVAALRSWCVAHGHRIRVRRLDSDLEHKVDLANGGQIVVTEWR